MHALILASSWQAVKSCVAAIGVVHFSCVASAAHFFYLCGDNMSAVFLCGNIDEEYLKKTDITALINIVKSIIEENKINRIYHCKRTAFDIKICDVISFLNPDIEIIELRDIHKKDAEYRLKQNMGAYRILCPFEEEIENGKLYQTLYDFAMDNSEILIAYSKFDDDISKFVIESTEEKGKTVFNIAEMFLKIAVD